MSVTIYHTGHERSTVICEALHKGTGFKVVQGRHGLVDDNAAMFYGVMRRNNELRDQCIEEGRDWYLVDNGYLRPGHFDGYYRITKNAFLCDGWGRPDHDRLRNLDIEIQPWQTQGDKILICVPPRDYGKLWHHDGDAWTRWVKGRFRGKTDRGVVLSYKPVLDSRCHPAQPPLWQQLARAWAVIVHDSTVAIDALIAGVPAVVTGDTPAKRCCLTDPADIETPIYSDEREELLAVLAANQWTIDEMKSGKAWRDLNG